MAPIARPRTEKLASLAEQVYTHLRRSIIAAELHPGDKLVELDLAAQMGTSQGPVREALQRLERDGLVERRARSATFVTSVSMTEMYELFSVRTMIERFAVQHTAQHITAEQCAVLDTLIEKMVETGGRNEIVTLAEYDMQFHRCIVEWSGSSGLLAAWLPLSSQIQRFITQSHPEYYPDFVEIGRRHSPILDALRRRHQADAVKAVQEHVMLIWTKIKPDRLL